METSQTLLNSRYYSCALNVLLWSFRCTRVWSTNVSHPKSHSKSHPTQTFPAGRCWPEVSAVALSLTLNDLVIKENPTLMKALVEEDKSAALRSCK